MSWWLLGPCRLPTSFPGSTTNFHFPEVRYWSNMDSWMHICHSHMKDIPGSYRSSNFSYQPFREEDPRWRPRTSCKKQNCGFFLIRFMICWFQCSESDQLTTKIWMFSCFFFTGGRKQSVGNVLWIIVRQKMLKTTKLLCSYVAVKRVN